MSSQPRVATTEFRTLLDELLAGASRGGLEQWIRARGEALPARERQRFLDDLAASLRQKRITAPAPRNLLADIDAFASMLLQTERFGTPIARALSVFADNIRLKRRQLAEEMAAKTTVKIIFPLVLFIFPSMFIVLLGPAALTIVRGMSSMGK